MDNKNGLTIFEEIDQLPKPYSMEEQYLYALVCELARVAPKEGYLVKQMTFKSPFWRLQQYWHAFSGAVEERLGTIVPDENTVSMETLTKEVTDGLLGEGKVTTPMIVDKNVTLSKLADAVADRLLGDKRVTEAMLADAVADRLLASGKITEEMLVAAVRDKLLGTNRVTKDMLSTEVQDILNKVK